MILLYKYQDIYRVKFRVHCIVKRVKADIFLFTMKFQLVIILVVTILNVMVNARPMDKEDECLLTCEYCFKDEVLLNCANQCLITPHNMGHPWLTICPYFGYVGFNKR